VDADLDTLATALYVTVDDFLIGNPQHLPWRPKVGIAARLGDAELVTLVVLQALLGFTSEARWLRYASDRLRSMFPYLPTQSGYNKRVRAAAGMLRAVIAHLVATTSRTSDDVWVVGRVRSLAGNRETLGSGRVGRVRVLRVALALLLGLAPAPAVHRVGAAGGVRAHRRQGR
jgi:hypothetical protein